MNYGTYILLFFLVTAITIIPNSLNAQVTIDYSAVSVFWELTDTLSSDRQPSDQLWGKFANHPAYAQIEKSGNRVTHLKRVLPIVFLPSKSTELEELLNGEDSFYRYLANHLNEVKINRQRLTEYLESGEILTYQNSYIHSFDYLPDDITSENIDLTVYIALFEENGFGGNVITIDLLHLLKGSQQENMLFFGHEFHHALRNESKKYVVFSPADTSHHPIVEALNKLPLEGVACLVDKSRYFDNEYYANADSLSEARRETMMEFRRLVNEVPLNLEQIDLALSGDLTEKEKGRKIFQNLPWSGHSVGFYMSTSIEKAFGRSALIEAQYSSIDFLLIYQEAAKKDENLYKFSDETIEFLESIN